MCGKIVFIIVGYLFGTAPPQIYAAIKFRALFKALVLYYCCTCNVIL